uniref:Uncharacterized protein n=1 Tax=Alexandrium monilatum TaxID=311494 RepID=A0A7S4V3V8_9DINO|mmetsp:Transcript_98980/g.295656  ORF Transcript_98980/g.295656 Transcript_98980/m.295656 type:complete len:222 (-) Transcript_98980:67-732(-)
MAEAALRTLCDARRLGDLPELGLDLRVMKYHTGIHPAAAVPGAGDCQYWIDTMVPDGVGGLLIKFVHSYKLNWEKEYRSFPYVHRLCDGKWDSPEDGLALFEKAKAEASPEVRLLCSLSAGQGGGREVGIDVGSTRLGQVFNYDTEEGAEAPPEFLLHHQGKVTDDDLQAEERVFLLGQLYERWQQAGLTTGDVFAKVDIYELIGDLIRHRQGHEGKQEDS